MKFANFVIKSVLSVSRNLVVFMLLLGLFMDCRVTLSNFFISLKHIFAPRTPYALFGKHASRFLNFLLYILRKDRPSNLVTGVLNSVAYSVIDLFGDFKSLLYVTA